MDEGRKESENRKYVDLRHDEELGGVHIIPVAEFVSWRSVQTDENRERNIAPTKDGFYLLGLALFDQSIENDDMFTLKENE